MSNLDNKKSLSTPQKKDGKNSILKNVTYEHSIPYVHKPVYKMFQQKEYSLLKEHFENMDVYFKGQTFNSHFEFKEFLIRNSSINMVSLLELTDNEDISKPLVDVLNPLAENNKASVFRSNTKNIEYYSFKQKVGFKKINIIELISRLLNVEHQETLKIVAYLFNIEIYEPLDVIEVRSNADKFVNDLRKNNLKDVMPNFYTLFEKDMELVCFLIETISKQEHYWVEKENKNVILSYISITGYRNLYEKQYTGYLKAHMNIIKFIQAMCLAELVIKIKTEELPKNVNIILEKSRLENNFVRRTDVLTIPNFTLDTLEIIENQCAIMVSKNFTKRSISKNMVIATYGIDEALKVFSQIKDNEKILAHRLVSTKNSASKVTTIQIAKQGFILEKDLVDRLFRNKKKAKLDITRDEVYWEIEQLRQVICEENNLESVTLTKNLRLELNISDNKVPKGKRPRLFKTK